MHLCILCLLWFSFKNLFCLDVKANPHLPRAPAYICVYVFSIYTFWVLCPSSRIFFCLDVEANVHLPGAPRPSLSSVGRHHIGLCLPLPRFPISLASPGHKLASQDQSWKKVGTWEPGSWSIFNPKLASQDVRQSTPL